MFSLKEFIKNGLLKAVGKMADYQVILNAAAWHEKGVLDEQDLSEIQAAIEAHAAGQTELVPPAEWTEGENGVDEEETEDEAEAEGAAEETGEEEAAIGGEET